MLLLAVVALVLPAVFQLVEGGLPGPTEESKQFSSDLETMSIAVAVVLLFTYLIGLLFSLRTHADLFNPHRAEDEEDGPEPWSVRRAVIMLTIAGIAVGVMSEILVGSISEASEDIGLSPFFVGVIVVAIIGSAAGLGRDLLRQSQQDGPLGQHLDRLERTDRAVRRAGARPAVVRHRRLPDGARVQRLRARSGSARGHDRDPRRPRRRVEWFEGVQLLAVYVVLAVTFFFV